MTQRFQGFASPSGVLVLDTLTGEVVRVDHDGATAVLRHTPLGLLAPALSTSNGSLLAPASGALSAEVRSTYPTPIAAMYRAYELEREPRQRCKLLVDACTAVLKQWAFLAVAEYLASDVADAALNQLLVRDLSRPLISSWALVVDRATSVLATAKVDLFAPELPRAYEAVERKCTDRVAIITRYVDERGQARERETRLGKIQALIRFRNGLAHGFNQPPDQAERDLEKFAPIFDDLVRASRFLASYPMYFVGRDQGGNPIGRRLVGDRASLEALALDVPIPEGQSFVLLDNRARRVLPLHAFFAPARSDALTSTESPEILSYDGRAKRAVLYVGADGDAVEHVNELDRWDRALAPKLGTGSEPKSSTLVLDQLSARAAGIRNETLERLRRGERYLQETVVARAALAEPVGRLVHGDQRGLVIAGDGGVGKTVALAALAEERALLGDVVLFYEARSLADADLGGRIRADLRIREPFFEDLLLALEPVLRGRAMFWIIVDGVNEHASPADLVRSLDGIVSQLADHDWARVVASVRATSYARLAAHARFGQTLRARYVVSDEIGPRGSRESFALATFDENETLGAYEKYRAHTDPLEVGATERVYRFRPSTERDALDPSSPTFAVLRNPLLHRLVLRAFHRRALPRALEVDEVMRLFVDQVVAERDGPHGEFPERRAFLRALAGELDRLARDVIGREALAEAASLRTWMRQSGPESPYVQLVDLGVLQEEWDDQTCVVRFAQPQLFDFVLAERIDAVVADGATLLGQAHRLHTFPALRGALVTVTRRMVADDRRGLLVEAFASAPDVLRSLLEDAGVEFASTGNPAFRALVEAMTSAATIVSWTVVSAIADRCFRTGGIHAAELALDIALASLERASVDRSEVAAALILRATIHHHRGAIAEAIALLDEARAVLSDGGSATAQLSAALLRARIAYGRGDLDAARNAYAMAADAAHRGGSLSAESEALRWLGSIAGRQGDLDERERLTREALAVAERAGDVGATSKALGNLGMVLGDMARLDEAEDAFVRALEAKRRVGDRASTATSLLNFGAFLHSQRHATMRAEACWQQARVIFDELGNDEGRSLADVNLAIAAIRRGQFLPARERLLAALDQIRAREDVHAERYAVWILGNVSVELNELESARGLAARLAAVADTPRARCHAAALEARVAVRDRDLGRALKAARGLEAACAGIDFRSWDEEDLPLAACREIDARIREQDAPLAERIRAFLP